MAKEAVTTIRITEDESKLIHGDFMALVNRTNKEDPDPKDLEKLNTVLDEIPALASQIGNLQEKLLTSIVEQMAGESAFGRECFKRHVQSIKDGLGYQTSSFVEKLLIDEIAMRWARLVQIEADHKRVTYREHSFKEGQYMEKRLHLTQKRYLSALEALTKTRKLIAATQGKAVEMYKNLTKEKENHEPTE